jgi:hypothetical protein
MRRSPWLSNWLSVERTPMGKPHTEFRSFPSWKTANLGQAAPHRRLFDYRVSTGEKAWRDLEPERPRGSPVENQLKRRRLLNRQVAGRLAPQQPIRIGCRSHIGGQNHNFAEGRFWNRAALDAQAKRRVRIIPFEVKEKPRFCGA